MQIAEFCDSFREITDEFGDVTQEPCEPTATLLMDGDTIKFKVTNVFADSDGSTVSQQDNVNIALGYCKTPFVKGKRNRS